MNIRLRNIAVLPRYNLDFLVDVSPQVHRRYFRGDLSVPCAEEGACVMSFWSVWGPKQLTASNAMWSARARMLVAVDQFLWRLSPDYLGVGDHHGDTEV